jgi:tetratricopeptide (TPR) repeat protein
MKVRKLFLFIVMIASPLLAQDYKSFIAKGDEYYAQFENKKALDQYEKAYNMCPDSFEALMKLTRAYNDVGEDLNSQHSKEYFEKAVQYAKLLVEKYPGKAASYFYLAATSGNLALFRGGREKVKLSRQIEKNAKKAIELDPKFDRTYVILGIYYREVANANWVLKAFAKSFFGGLPDGTNQDSERMLLKAIELNPGNIYAHYELARTYEKMRKIDKAIKHLQKAIELPIVDHQDKQIKVKAQTMLKQLSRRQK